MRSVRVGRRARQVPVRRPMAVAALAVLVPVIVITGCGGGSAAPSASPATSIGPARSRAGAPAASPPSAPAASASGSQGSATSPAAAPGLVFTASTSILSPEMRARMTGVSWHRGCPVGLGQLRLLRLSYWGFDHAAHTGSLVVNVAAAPHLTRAFGLLFAARFPIRQLRPVEAFGGSDEASMRADNTSAFNCRLVPATSIWS
jgi:hypothetical protein